MVIDGTKVHFIVIMLFNLILFCYVILYLHRSNFVILNIEDNIYTIMHILELVQREGTSFAFNFLENDLISKNSIFRNI